MTTRTRRFLRRHAKVLFKPAARYPADPRAVFILALSVFGGLTALALNAAPESLDSLLPAWGVIIWGIVLTLGSAGTLVGMARQTVTGILIEQFGSVVVGVACVYYSVLAFYVVGIGAIQSVGIVAAWGISCFIRWIQLQALVAQSQRKADLNRLNAEIDRRISER